MNRPMVVKPAHALSPGDIVCFKGSRDELIFAPVYSALQTYNNNVIISTAAGSFTISSALSVAVFIEAF